MARKLLDQLASIRFFFICAGCLLLACALGGIVPQGESPEEYHQTYGRTVASFILSLGWNNLFKSYWFLGLLGLSGINLLACSLKRYKALLVRPGVFISHAAILLLFAGGIIRGVYGQKGHLPMNVDQVWSGYINDGYEEISLPFSIKLKAFRIHYWEQEKHILHVVYGDSPGQHASAELVQNQIAEFKFLNLKVLPIRFYPEFALEGKSPVSRSEARENPAWELSVQNGHGSVRQFVFSRFPDFHGDVGRPFRLVYEYVPGRVRQFESDLEITDTQGPGTKQTISVNSPMSYQGYRLYQSGYDPKNMNFSSIQIVKDPSVWVIYTGFILLMLGLAWSFWR
ncbi:MAG: cytochrome c biogenesis protein ResB [Elusimicrobia bacterium]|nr:cytochrome c biogenesis protein ResB [Elusimicrobiota bacterium]